MEEVFRETFGEAPRECADLPRVEGYMAQIPFEEGEKAYMARVWVEKPALRRLADLLLFDDDPDHETMEDLTAELANFIVGRAKMVASDRALPYRMGTPRYEGLGRLEEAEGTILYDVEGHCIALQIKESHA